MWCQAPIATFSKTLIEDNNKNKKIKDSPSQTFIRVLYLKISILITDKWSLAMKKNSFLISPLWLLIQDNGALKKIIQDIMLLHKIDGILKEITKIIIEKIDKESYLNW